MFNCAKEILSYHDGKVTLPQSERTAMRDRRDRNRERIKKGLDENGKPKPLDFWSQGSYAMKTMVQHPDNNYDIDDGIYFDKEELKGSQGAYLTALAARQMVRDAVDDGSFKNPPEARKNCVRVYYAAGYHVDIPVYRRVVTKNFWGQESVHYELAAADWVRSDARDVTNWFDEENKRQSPDDKNGRQMRRQTRLIKKYAQSRPSWKGQIGSGFMITKLVTERYQSYADREDKAFYYTIKGIHDRLEYDLVVKHPVTPDATISKGSADPKARFLKEKLSDAINNLSVLFEDDCTEEKAMKAWDKVFNTTYFTDKLAEKNKNAQKAAATGTSSSLTTGMLKNWGQTSEPQNPVNKQGGGRYA